jgi:hypothetical protein
VTDFHFARIRITTERSNMSLKTDLAAISHTANSKAVEQAASADVNSLIGLINQHIAELKYLIGQFQAKYPSSGGDASNYTALTTLLNELN